MKKDMIFFDPLSDFGFKRIFASENNKDLLIDFLNACIADDVGTITDITFLPSEQLGERPEDKLVIFDIFCENQNGDRFIIEMQRSRQPFFADRIISYVSRVISREMEKGESDYAIPDVYSFNLLDYNAPEFKGNDRFFHKVMLKDETNEIFSDRTTYFFVELCKFAAVKDKTLDNAPMRRWLELLTSIGDSTNRDYGAEEQGVFRKFIEECRITKLTNMERKEYKKSVLEYKDVQGAIICAREDGVEEGFGKGMEKGLNEGKRQLVRNMLAKGLDPALIAEISGLTHEEIIRMQQI
ncbi:MAG: Rpn family recombination-promoting nuclease/putative transposase [Bacteroidales bacterium]|nr:Rpn family recombination-promoting nuclease/putative transposase [Bacteroidales bacterium]